MSSRGCGQTGGWNETGKGTSSTRANQALFENPASAAEGHGSSLNPGRRSSSGIPQVDGLVPKYSDGP
jgi:hypothetical protein